VDYGYGDAGPDEGDYGYGDAEPAPAPVEAETKRPKRRCSVTKFSLESQEGPASGLMAADVIKNFRNSAPPPPPEPVPVPVPVPEPVVDDCCKSTVTDDTFDSSAEITPSEQTAEMKAKAKSAGRKKGMMNRIRRRLSVAM